MVSCTGYMAPIVWVGREPWIFQVRLLVSCQFPTRVMGEGKTMKLLCVLWPMRQFGVFCWRGMLELLSSVYIKKLFLDRKVFLASLWCHASGTFRGVSLADWGEIGMLYCYSFVMLCFLDWRMACSPNCLCIISSFHLWNLLLSTERRLHQC